MILYNFDLLASLVRLVQNNPSIVEDFSLKNADSYLQTIEGIDDELFVNLEMALTNLIQESYPFQEDFLWELGKKYRDLKYNGFDQAFDDINVDERDDFFTILEFLLAELYWACAIEAGRRNDDLFSTCKSGVTPDGVFIAPLDSKGKADWDRQAEIHDWSELFETQNGVAIRLDRCDDLLESLRILSRSTFLRELRISNCPGLSDPALSNLIRCESLESLTLEDCSSITAFGILVTSMCLTLKKMRIVRCHHVQDLTFVETSGLTSLEMISCDGAETLKLYQSKLEKLQINCCPEIRVVFFDRSKDLRSLELLHCTKLCSNPLLSGKEPLSRVRIVNCPSLTPENLRFIGSLPRIDVLEVDNASDRLQKT